jgi:hypothetical protein
LIVGVAYAAESAGRLQGTAAGVGFDVEGTCEVPKESTLGFRSDEAGTSDSNGDGAVVQIFRSGKIWTLSLEKDGETIYMGSPGAFTKDGDTYTLKKSLKRRKQKDEIAVDLTLRCGGTS